MPVATQIDLEDYVDQKIKLTKKPVEGKAPEVVEGKVEAANNEKGIILVKVKGKSSAVLILRFEVDEIERTLSSEDDVTQTALKPVKLNNVRRHLVAAHGWLLSQVNKLTDEEAFAKHGTLHDGEDSKDLGHRHEA